MAGGEVGPRVRAADRSEGAVVAVPAGPVAHLHEMLAVRPILEADEVLDGAAHEHQDHHPEGVDEGGEGDPP